MDSKLILPHPSFRYHDPAVLLNGGSIIRETIPRFAGTGNLSALTSGVMLSVALPLQKDDKVNFIHARSGGTAAGSPTNYWVALYSPAGALLAQSADQEDAAWAADTTKKIQLASEVVAGSEGVYFAALMVAAGTPPTLVGVAVDDADVSDGLITGQVNLAQTSGSSLTDTAPATIATPTAVVNIPYLVASES